MLGIARAFDSGMAKQTPEKKPPRKEQQPPIDEPPNPHTGEKPAPIEDPPADPVDDNSPMEVIVPDSNPGLDGFK